MTYLHAARLTCAQGAAEPCEFPFLGQTQTVPYFRAFPQKQLNRASLIQLLLQHIAQTIEQAGWHHASLAHDTAIFLGSTAYSVAEYEYELAQQNHHHSPQYTLNTFSADLQQHYPLPIYCFATSCTSAAYALQHAHQMLQQGWLKRALVIGVESFNVLTLAHFHSLGLLGEHCRPFQENGMVLGEGIACLALSNTAPNTAQQLRLLSIAAHTDTSSLTEASASSLSQVMHHALQTAHIHPNAIQAVKAHAVGSLASDQAEQNALTSIFQRTVPIWCYKPLFGHTLGASAALETAWLYHNLAQQPTGHYLTNFFGFGGSHLSAVWAWHNTKESP